MDSRVFGDTLIDMAVLSEATEWRIIGDIQTSENTLTDNDIQQLLGLIFLKRPLTLQLFNLGLTDTQVITILKSLETNDSITHLDLSCNRITDQSASAIANLLITNNYIKELVLTSNGMTNQGMGVIAQALIINNTLCSLDVINNLHTHDAWQVFEDALASNHEMNEIKLFSTLAKPSVLGHMLTNQKTIKPHHEAAATSTPPALATILERNDSHHKQTDERLKKLSLFAQSDKKAIELAKANAIAHASKPDHKTMLSKIGKSETLPKLNNH